MNKVPQNDNIKLDYSLNINVGSDFFQCRNGAEFFMDEHGVQWAKFVPSNGYAAGCEHIVRTERVIIVRTNAKQKKAHSPLSA